jgi:hypothetical protein
VVRFVIAPRLPTAFCSAFATIACRSAIKRGDRLDQPGGEHQGNVIALCLAPLELYCASLRRGSQMMR